MKRLIVVLGTLAAVWVVTPAANAVDVCGYVVANTTGFLCPLRNGNTVCLSVSAATGLCEAPLQCFGGRGFFCLATLVPRTGPQAQCPFASKRATGFKCFMPTRFVPQRSNVNVELAEFHVSPDRSSVPAGHVHFHVSNVGEDMHEFLVIRTDLAPDMLPVNTDGSYEEDGPGTHLLDEIELVPSGESRDLDIDLAAGHYVLICNMVHMEEDGEIEVHYQLGMRTAFTVL
jgi:hypothetical protein